MNSKEALYSAVMSAALDAKMSGLQVVVSPSSIPWMLRIVHRGNPEKLQFLVSTLALVKDADRNEIRPALEKVLVPIHQLKI